ncbi:SPOR domain-containing protein [Sphingomonas sanguinis]|jgi:Flp pilus assembly protein TadD|uniref:SPOR domain-containing protein n=2 Tax=Sphingomonas sanguinis TaxID=33051 RepID=A0A7Y7UQJ2_9SPHN|nr:SPOR domain-containing protein [Sphingomonas sanguinis]MBZ6380576.1 SPOR domain-containing protein [Sphingomonas sanguinis]NNG49613.1 SPOR domain-containing protein [Sphingomonas sanguinis]NNG53209.1 SPOR domain-containing protein [Sphingomonas sanguinis]NVP29878.1 SPOR domain-containing protein [Sphingomonas sanguinis]
MTFAFFPRASLALALALAAAPMPLFAQEVVQPLPGTTDADKLGDVMRRVAQNPRNVDALVEAADLSIHLDDLSGAASLLARAEKVDPRDPRVKAGMGSILVRSERPGEALRYFSQAEAAGLPAAKFAGDRGLAYDLIGDQARAQRDYRLALANGASDEIVRRYALSLGISGRKDQALEQLDPLLRKTDRAAWRARAFILAMGGDLPEATRIASTMMPPQLAQGLQPFFQRLPTLPAIDRAFAVHFGETRATPERLADARLAPNLPPLTPEAPVALASATPVTVPTTQPVREDRRRGSRQPMRENRGVALAAAVPQSGVRTPIPTTVTPAPVASAPTQMASAVPVPATTPRVVAATLPTRTAQPQPGFSSTLPATTPVPDTRAPVAMASTAPVPMVQPLPTASQPSPAATTAMVQPLPSTAPVQTVQAEPSPAPVATTPPPTALAMVQPVPSQTAEPAPVAPAPRATRSGGRRPSLAAAHAVREDSILARIVANLSIPASELGVEGPERPVVVAAATPVTTGSQRVLAEARAKAERDHEAREKAAETIEPKKTEPKAPTAAERKAAAAKLAAEKKAAAAKKAEAAEKALAAKEALEEKKRAKANPERIWVQVAGGANEDDLPKAWAATKAKAPELFAGHKGYKTPLRATHRVLTGPFKTDAEARAFVNQLAKKGISAFPVTSDAGQSVTRLDAK